MCRLLGMLSVRAASPAWAMSEAPCSLLRLSNARAGKFQSDGWGLGWFDGSAAVPHLVKSRGATYREASLVRRSAADASGTAAIAHIRRASNPRKLPKGKIQGLENTQPFTHGNFLFAHNGTVNFPVEFAPLLGPFRKNIRGVNDSEILFWLIARHQSRGKTFPDAYVAAIRDMRRAWRRLPASRRAIPPFHGLNVVATDGQTLHAATYFEEKPGDAPPALMRDGWPYWQLAYRADARGIVVASEPLDRNPRDWNRLPPNCFLEATARAGRIFVQITPLVV
jgi:glutamine amidotransferase